MPNKPHPVRVVVEPPPSATAPTPPTPAPPSPPVAQSLSVAPRARLTRRGYLLAGSIAVAQILAWLGLLEGATFQSAAWLMQANLFADILLVAGTFGLGVGIVAGAAWAAQRNASFGTWIPGIAIAALLATVLHVNFAVMSAPGYIWLSTEGLVALPDNGFFAVPWNGDSFVAAFEEFPFVTFLLAAAGATAAVALAPKRPLDAHSAPEATSPVVRTASTRPFVAEKRANGRSLHDTDPHKWIAKEGIKGTATVALPELLIDEVIGQEEAVEVARKAARQRRHLLLLGDPGTGKSMIAKAMVEILPPAHLDDVLLHANPKDENVPKVRVVPGGQGRVEAAQAQEKARKLGLTFAIMEWGLSLGLVAGSIWAYFALGGGTTGLILMVMCIIAAVFFMFVARTLRGKPLRQVPNLLIERAAHEVPAPYVDATGSHHGALLGDVRHDPFQSGGLQTPTHLRVEPGAIHRAHKGLLFIDEINVLRLDSQQALLTAMQERKYAITGQSERSSGAMARTEPVPCDFILVAAGNLDVIAPQDSRYAGLHPALRSRIRGYGYEVYVKSVMDDTDDNRRKLVRFVAQEVRRDGRIPHFDAGAIAEVLREAQRRSGHSGKLTLRLRELGGLVRTAGDIARDAGEEPVTVNHVLAAKRISMSLEHQVTRRGIEVTTAKEALTVGGEKVGAAVGCAFMGTGETGEPAGIVVPVEADATPSADRQKGSIFLGGGLEANRGLVDSLSAVLKRFRGADMAGIDLHAQALLQQPSADVQALGAAAAVACLSALEKLPVRQDTVVLGAVAVGGRLRGVDGVTQMVEGAADLGYTRAVVPEANQQDLLLEHAYRERIEVLLAPDLAAALGHALAVPKSRLAAIEKALKP